MKKIIVTTMFFCALWSTVSAQEFRFGLTASPVFDWARVDGELYENVGTKLGFQYGLLFDQTIGSVERYAFSTGILINYVNVGISSTDTANIISAEWTARSQYIEIPLTIRLRTNEVNYFSYYGQFGLTPGVCIKSRGDLSINDVAIYEDVNLRDKDNLTGGQYQLFNVSLTLGIGAEYSIAENTNLIGGIFFQNGFANILDDDVDDNSAFLKQLGIRVGVLF
ncbi:MAG TPA: outer membrane beta-barrel protein [Chitinophagales bacterium]|nr:outer membrane beta-barrel protein [Chitinophagales bacterium]HRG27604.1 outer membrane beta-barrel protein [Chitinophagales bacterium]HRG85859.1 outer membrane beta-barrel protein [Chitinophagales bacterium]HRH51946.1 outer membrane beta-barrel protein [Chitinophagales bacterium]